MIIEKEKKRIVNYNFNCIIDFVNVVLLIKCKNKKYTYMFLSSSKKKRIKSHPPFYEISFVF